MPKIQGFVLYKIYYGDKLAYLGRTKQPLQDRLRGHFFQKPMFRKISLDMTTRIQYAIFQTEADMNRYEIYYILTLKPLLNGDDKARAMPTVQLPEVIWQDWTSPILQKWRDDLVKQEASERSSKSRYHEIFEEISIIRGLRRTGELGENEAEEKIDALKSERKRLEKILWGR